MPILIAVTVTINIVYSRDPRNLRKWDSDLEAHCPLCTAHQGAGLFKVLLHGLRKEVLFLTPEYLLHEYLLQVASCNLKSYGSPQDIKHSDLGNLPETKLAR